MPEGMTSEKLLNNIMETLSDGISKQKSGSFFEEEFSNTLNTKFNKLFGRQKPVHHILGGGKCKICSLLLSLVSWLVEAIYNFFFLRIKACPRTSRPYGGLNSRPFGPCDRSYYRLPSATQLNWLIYY